MLSNRTLPIFLAVALILAAGFFLSHNLGRGMNLGYDEFYSLERSNGFDKYHDWLSVYSLNEPTAKKPPLQYWLNGLAMKLGVPDILSLRLWSYLFFLGLLVVTAWTSYYLANNNPWVIPASVLLLCSSTQLVQLARSGMLDAGMGFFMMGSLLVFCYARHNPKLWLLCGVFAGLGALQKAPTALLFMGLLLYILKKTQDPDYQWSALRKNRYFNQGYRTALLLFLLWPILQTFKYGANYINVAIKKEMLDRFSPLRAEATENSGALDWISWLWHDLHMLAIVACICTLCIIAFPRWRKENTTFALAVLVCVILSGFALASGKIYSRYLAIVTPLLICMTAKVLADVLPWKPSVLVVSAVLLAVSFSDVQQTIGELEGGDSYTRYQKMVAHIDEFREESDFVVIKRELIPPGAYGYFGASKAPFRTYGAVDKRQLGKFREDIEETGLNAVLGMNLKEDQPALMKAMPNLDIVDINANYIVWRYRPLP